MSKIHFPEADSQIEKIIENTRLQKYLTEIKKSAKGTSRFQRNLAELSRRSELTLL